METIAPAIDPLSPNNFELAQTARQIASGLGLPVSMWQRQIQRIWSCLPCTASKARRLGLSAFHSNPLTEPNDQAGSAGTHP